MNEYLIIRLSSLGDIVHALPAFAALRRREPEARISWVVEPKGREILDLVEGLDEIIAVGEPGWTEKLRRRDRIALDFQGLLKSAWIGWRSRSRRRLGFSAGNLREPAARWFYTETAPPLSEDDHVILKNLRMLELLGYKETLVRFPLSVPAALVQAAHERLSALGWNPGLRPVIFNVGAAWPTKRWFPERWTETLRRLDRAGLFPALLWGTEEERRTAEDVGRASGVPVLPFFSVRETFGLLKISALIVSGDTFALQAAAAVGLPAVAVFGPTNPRRNGPFTPRDRVVYHELPCGRCYRRACPDPKCLKAVAVDEVLEAVREALASSE
ncbi:MAG TPA: glycosyltransferase family 9 protein [Candidatus Aminicenantes bacterium]|jgi:ADP-heptose:LPS heptosyltransferase|nr:glycosyltransferase family 9 protein [Acidobacteriota bacterium]HNQ81699.1 glycosyltransferase family 9 protein [Candidatus Aminicenantes bacterium]MDW3227117.1 glycosyltransferase family 9 protein [Acidobacteriota bacterium]HOF82300.1 glycosyltransferase family 9 protein [Candidatus Aminicenantes bacterium]HOS11163.1 glycosyltransferase family 9 protein [Candidatus Aminicenantes bacterium]